MNKKKISFLVAIMMAIIVFPVQAFAIEEDRSSNNIVSSHTFVDEDGTLVTDTIQNLTYEEAVLLLAEKKGITINAAAEALGNENTRSARATSYSSRLRTYNWGGYTVEIGGIWLVYSEGSFREFREFKEGWTGASGSGSYTWNEFYVTDVTTTYPTTHAFLEGRGALEVAISSSLTSTVGANLIASNFSVSGSVGNTTYYRRVETISFDWSLY